MEIKKSPSLLKVDEVGADQKMAPLPQTEEAVEVDAAFAAGAGGGSNHASSTDQSNDWVDDVDNNPYEYPQASSSTDTTANSN